MEGNLKKYKNFMHGYKQCYVKHVLAANDTIASLRIEKQYGPEKSRVMSVPLKRNVVI